MLGGTGRIQRSLPAGPKRSSAHSMTVVSALKVGKPERLSSRMTTAMPVLRATVTSNYATTRCSATNTTTRQQRQCRPVWRGRQPWRRHDIHRRTRLWARRSIGNRCRQCIACGGLHRSRVLLSRRLEQLRQWAAPGTCQRVSGDAASPRVLRGGDGVARGRRQDIPLALTSLASQRHGATSPMADQIKDGYHRVWGRDLYQQAMGLIAAGDSGQALRMAHFLWDRQFISADTAGRRDDISTWLVPALQPCQRGRRGDPQQLGCCEQLDQEGFAILLAWMTGLTDNATYQKIKMTADHVRDAGPSTTERWEEQLGQSPSSIAAEIAGLVAAADIARQHGDTTSAARWELTADAWRRDSPIGRTRPTDFGAATTTMSASTRRRTLMMTISSTSKRATSLPAT